MPDITQHESIPVVQRRFEGQGQGGGKEAPHGQPSRKVAASYQEVASSKPLDDRITILGIPVEQITPATQAALAGLVAEINHLRNVVKRHERVLDKRSGQGQNQSQATGAATLEPEAFLRALGATLAQPASSGHTWVVVLVHVATYEDIRRSSGLLAANSALADVAHRLKDASLKISPPQADTEGVPSASTLSVAGVAAMSAVRVVSQGYVGGSNLAAGAELPVDGLDTQVIARAVRDHLSAGGYLVGGIDMALAITVAAAAVGVGESPLLALGRADHTLRTH